MTQEDRELLKDLCARLPYGVKAHAENVDLDGTISALSLNSVFLLELHDWWNIEFIKPYLRPMSSMTEEEKRHISKIMCLRTYDDGVVHNMTYPVYTPYYVMEDCLSYLRSIHVDYSGLIEKNLALEAKEGMYNIKEK